MTTDTTTASGAFVAVDGGGTQTTLIVADGGGQILAAVRGGSSNMKSLPWTRVREELIRLLEEGLRGSGVSLREVRGIALGLAGGDRSEDKARVRDLLRDRLPAQARVSLYNDAQTALAAGTHGRRGVVLIAGTGSIACGYDPESGEYVRVGGWGYVMGDEGSGFDLGRRALQAVMRAHDGRGPQTLLTGEILGELGLTAPPELVTAIYEADNMRARTASLARALFRAARRGDETARWIAAEAAGELARLVQAACARLSFGARGVPLVLSGGVFGEPALMEAFAAQEPIQALAPERIALDAPPVLGSYYYALAAADIPLTPHIIERATRYWRNEGE
ncbi:N-acetylglucosamine kinase [Paenibacillus sp. IB182496]|uniref:N-acetylglucosamine kinase n=1 Tax=Paenibacillus sabuli TaxID=2772509 RepID=A0A927BT72_9BACL|nr:BadF/BadG/BcrA/BcrD ATPase family protein [Paenibacillus sabuli]MBD2846343.1 N-acetylglucosamine kinase [Paenibacillus sabuli]